MSPATADKLGVEFGSFAHGGEHGGYDMPVVELELEGRTVKAPAWIMPGHADDSITVWLGYGRTAAGRVGGDGEHAVGFNAYRLRTTAHPWFARGLKVRRTDDTYLLACTQHHHQMEERHPVRAATLADYQKDPDFVKTPLEEDEGPKKLRAEPPLTFYDKQDFTYDPPLHKWGMAIDLTACVGCNACIVACQAENNIPVVGKEQVRDGPGDALDPRRPLYQRDLARAGRVLLPARCLACTANRRPANMSAPSRRRCTAPRALTT